MTPGEIIDAIADLTIRIGDAADEAELIETGEEQANALRREAEYLAGAVERYIEATQGDGAVLAS